MATALARLIVSVSELESALDFYRDILGLDVTGRVDGFAWLSVSGIELMLHERPSAPSDSSVSIAFLVEDVFATVERWRDAGGVVIDEPAQQSWSELMAVLRDADGHVVCISNR